MPAVANKSRCFYQRLRVARKAARMTQGELATATGLEKSAVSHFECGRRTPSLENLRKLVAALGCTADYLLGLEDVEC